MKEKMYWGVISFILISLFLVGCSSGSETSGSGDESDGVVTLEVWDYNSPDSPSEDQLLGLLEQYEESNENVKFKRTYIPFGDLKTKLLQGVAGNELPDIVLIDNPDHQSFAEAGVFADITDEVNEWGEADLYYEGPMASVMLDGKYYGIPNDSNALALYYNKDLFNEAGIDNPPKTWDELREVAKELTTSETKGLAIAGAKIEEATFQFLPYLWQSGADLDNFDSPEAISAMKLIQDMVNDGSISENVINMDQNDALVQFQTGKAAMMVNGPWQLPRLREESADLNFEVALMPEGKQAASILGGENWAITSTTENKDEAWEFLKWTQQPDVMGPLHELGGQLPNRSDVAEDEQYEWNEDKQMQVFVQQIQTAKPRAYGSNYPEISTIVQEAIQRALTDEDVETVMKESAEKINPLLP
ncbi:sugar ABC transporter substrate-binding protein [Oceanobacillus caeni]|uniref:ABC transporter substrate-binding protein n=1 Tax=Oceanobacillus caeni TaxID=405946 RepID=UPI001C23C96C|nr:sugar ABC transporter substrate-binding protein [Oceanobacillus caeni]MBU8791157.1 sugar ABC transporter substrate-binding protein [Oceanobacillus caeni]